MGDLRNKARKEAETAEIRRCQELQENGWTVFRYDFAPRFTRRNLTLGEAARELRRLTGTKIGFWRCPVRGLGVEFRERPTTNYLWDEGERSRLLCFSVLEGERAAKMQLVEHIVLAGMGGFRGLPKRVFDQQVSIIQSLLAAPVSTDHGEWLKVKSQLHSRIQPLLKTHQADLRNNLG